MDFSWRFDRWFERLPRSPADRGVVCRVVVRPAHGERAILPAADVSPELGVHGDKWHSDPRRTGDDQVSVVNVHVIDALAEDSEHAALCGDNLHVDLDLSEANLPTGTRLVVGSAVLEVTAKPHRPCRHFVARFGAMAAKRVARATRVGRRGRGVLCRVVRAGRIAAGDSILVERPGEMLANESA